MSRLREALARERTLWRQKREIQALQDELAKLRTQNDRMRSAMRRCLTCEYRAESEARGFSEP